MSSRYDKQSLKLHKKFQGKLGFHSRIPLKNRKDLSLAYTPGVGAVSLSIAKDKKLTHTHTLSGRTVAIISDGSAILGLGNLGAEAAMPVMEGKAVLFKEFADVDAFPIVLATQDVEEIISTIKAIAPTFAGINLEDISAPRCFEIEKRLIDELSIPVMHDDQHGTAIVVLAALTNALKVVKKDIRKIKLVVNGAGAAAIATTRLLISAGVRAQSIIMIDSKGSLHTRRKGISKEKRHIADTTNADLYDGGLEGALFDADVFIGMSKADVLHPEWISLMHKNPIVFAMANPNPEISYDNAMKTSIVVFGTGRSDYPNQINNVLAFPGIFRGALDCGATKITGDMKIASAKAIASLVSKKNLKMGIVIPDPFNKRVSKAVAKAIVRSWKNSTK